MPRPGFKQGGVLTVKHLLLILGHNGAGGDRFLGEEIGAADLEADACPAIRQGGGHGGYHRGGQSILDAAGKKDMKSLE